jgi:hypothetical protein
MSIMNLCSADAPPRIHPPEKQRCAVFPAFCAGKRRRGVLASGSLEVMPASVRGPCPLTILSLVTPELPPPGTSCDSAKTTASMRQNREVGICLRHSCRVMPRNYSVAVGHLCLFPRRGGTSVVSIYRGRSASPFR